MEKAYDNIAAGPFVPSIEYSVQPDTFLSASTYATMTAGDYQHTVPYLTGYNEHEGSYVQWCNDSSLTSSTIACSVSNKNDFQTALSEWAI